MTLNFNLANFKKIFFWSESPRILCAILAIMLIAQWSYQSHQLYHNYQFSHQLINQYKANSTSSQPPIAKTNQRLSLISQASQTPLFGLYIPKRLIKESMLNLLIVGILLSNNPSESVVILKTPSGQERPYKVGDKVSDNAQIKQITAEGILLEYQGTLERLELPKLTGM